MSKERTQAHTAMFNSFAMPDEHSFGVYKALQDVYPAFSKKIFEDNEFMQRVVMSNYNPMDILDYPVCGKCETLAAPSGYAVKDLRTVPKCTCFKCGSTTVNPVSFRAWIKYELKKRVKPDFFEAIELATDAIALTMLKTFMRNMKDIMIQHSVHTAEKMGHKESVVMQKADLKPEVKHYREVKPRLPKDVVEITDNLQEDV